MRKHNLYQSLIFCLIASIIISCETENQSNVEAPNSENTSENKESIEIEIIEQDFEFLPPSPIQIASILKKANY